VYTHVFVHEGTHIHTKTHALNHTYVPCSIRFEASHSRMHKNKYIHTHTLKPARTCIPGIIPCLCKVNVSTRIHAQIYLHMHTHKPARTCISSIAICFRQVTTASQVKYASDSRCRWDRSIQQLFKLQPDFFMAFLSSGRRLCVCACVYVRMHSCKNFQHVFKHEIGAAALSGKRSDAGVYAYSNECLFLGISDIDYTYKHTCKHITHTNIYMYIC
jgi:hypothetical protein